MARPTVKITEKMLSYHAEDDQDILLLIETVRRGISYPVFISITHQSPFSLAEWSAFLNLSDRTLQRYKKENKKFDSVSSEKILQVVMLYRYGLEVFGSPEKLNLWLNSANAALGGRVPRELLDSSFGISMLKDELTRMEHGVLA